MTHAMRAAKIDKLAFASIGRRENGDANAKGREGRC